MASFINYRTGYITGDSGWVIAKSKQVKTHVLGKKLTDKEKNMVAKKVIQKRTIEMTETLWQIAEKEFNAIRFHPHPAYNDFKLLPKQVGLSKELQKNLKALNGEPVLEIANDEGNWYSSYPYRGMILKAREIAGDYDITIVLYPPEQGDWVEDQIRTVKLWQIIQARAVYIPEEKDLKEEQFLQLVKNMNQERNEQLITLERKHRDYRTGIESKEKDIAMYKKTMVDIEEKMKSVRVPNLAKDDVIKMFSLLNKNKKIANAYLTTAGKMVVETRMLYATDPKTQKMSKTKPVGRIAMELSIKGISACRFTNLDFCYHNGGRDHYPHPNIQGQSVCYGANGKDLDNMAKGGNFYELIDFLIIFFSLFPHDSGGPHIAHEKWLANRGPEKKENPFSKPERFWELHAAKAKPDTGTAKKGRKKAGTNPLDGLATFAKGVDIPDPRNIGIDNMQNIGQTLAANPTVEHPLDRFVRENLVRGGINESERYTPVVDIQTSAIERMALATGEAVDEATRNVLNVNFGRVDREENH